MHLNKLSDIIDTVQVGNPDAGLLAAVLSHFRPGDGGELLVASVVRRCLCLQPKVSSNAPPQRRAITACATINQAERMRKRGGRD